MKPNLRNLRSHPVRTVVVLALIVRLAFVIAQLQLHLFDISFDASDSNLYRSLAESLIHGDGFARDGVPTAFVTPGFPLFLAALYLISRATMFIALVNCVLGALTVGFIAAIALRVGGRSAAWAGGLFAAIFPHLVFWTGYVLTETLYVFLVVVSLYLLIRAAEERSPAWAASAGLAIGAAFLVRPIILGFALLMLGAGLFDRRLRKSSLAAGLALLAVVGAWTLRNTVVLDAPVVTSTESGYVLWQGNSPGATGGTRGYVDDVDFDPLEMPAGTGEVEADRIYMREALEWMRDHPLKVLALAPKKLWNQWRPTYEGASTINWLATLATYPLLLVGSALGFIRGKRTLPWVILLAFFCYHLLVHGLVTGMIRFRLPVEAALFPMFGAGIASFVDRRRT